MTKTNFRTVSMRSRAHQRGPVQNCVESRCESTEFEMPGPGPAKKRARAPGLWGLREEEWRHPKRDPPLGQCASRPGSNRGRVSAHSRGYKGVRVHTRSKRVRIPFEGEFEDSSKVHFSSLIGAIVRRLYCRDGGPIGSMWRRSATSSRSIASANPLAVMPSLWGCLANAVGA